jgi:hypothetical protein
MTQIGSRAGLVAAVLGLSLAACSSPSEPSLTSVAGPSAVESVAASVGLPALPGWIANPLDLPPGRVGKNNCTFSFGQVVPQWDFHADAGCWESEGPDGWTRQQFQRIHIASFPRCGGGTADATAIRVCRSGGSGQPSPCLIDPVTGPTGCARCVVLPVCH